MNELTILDFALGIALLYHWGADGKEIRGTRITGLKQGYTPAKANDFRMIAVGALTSSPTFALRVSGGGFPLLGDSCSRSTGFLLHRAT